MAEELPKNWTRARLEDLIVFALGGDWGKGPDHDDPEYVNVRCIRASEIRDWDTQKGSTAALRRVKSRSLESRELREGDILVEISGGGPEQPVGRTVLIDRTVLSVNPETPKICTNFFRLARPASAINSAYLNLYLQYFHATGRVRAYQGGSNNLRNLKFAEYLTINVPIPPELEQARIVARLDELSSHLDQADDALKTAYEQLSFYRQAVLHAAFRDIADFRKLPTLLSEKMSNGYSGKPVKYKTDFRVLRLTATTSGVFSDQHFKYLDEDGLTERNNIWCQTDDILVQRGNTAEYVGVPAIYTGPSNAFIYPDLMIRLRANESLINTKYLHYALSSPRLRNHLRTRAKGSAGSMPKISQAILASVDVPYCDPPEQISIVERIDSKLSYSLSLEAEITECRAKLSRLRLSILKSAFSGRLVSQDPADEPASVLLDRIQAERHALSNSTKKRKAAS